MNDDFYTKNLIAKIVKNSNSTTWKEAIYEWEIVGWDKDIDMQSVCICGKESIRYLFKIKNKKK